MHPVPGQRLAAEHIKAMTAAAGIARSARQAHRARPGRAQPPLTGALPVVPGARSGGAGRTGVPRVIASCTEGNAHAAGNQ